MDQGFEIRNTKDEPKIPEEPQTPQTRNISVSKTWVGERADQVVVHLLADGEEVNQVVLSKANGWIHIFNNLPKEKAGKMIFYTVKEEPLEGYTSVVEGDMARGFVIRNTKEDPKIPEEPQKPETRNISVSKTWVGESADQVVVHLLADGDVVKNVVLNKANGWSYTFTDLPKENAGGEIHYTVEEEPLTGYTAVVEGDMESGFVIRNTKEEPKKPNEPKTPNPNEPKKPNPKTPKKDGKNAPRTGDMAAIGLYGLIGVGAAAGWLALQKKKRSENGR